jgi:IS30 family transposase
VKEIEYDKFKQIILNNNSTPRKLLKWLTPLEVFNKALEQLQYKS